MISETRNKLFKGRCLRLAKKNEMEGEMLYSDKEALLFSLIVLSLACLGRVELNI